MSLNIGKKSDMTYRSQLNIIDKCYYILFLDTFRFYKFTIASKNIIDNYIPTYFNEEHAMKTLFSLQGENYSPYALAMFSRCNRRHIIRLKIFHVKK